MRYLGIKDHDIGNLFPNAFLKSVCLCVCVFICMCVYYVYMCISVYVHIRLFIHNTHAHTHTYAQREQMWQKCQQLANVGESMRDFIILFSQLFRRFGCLQNRN